MPTGHGLDADVGKSPAKTSHLIVKGIACEVDRGKRIAVGLEGIPLVEPARSFQADPVDLEAREIGEIDVLDLLEHHHLDALAGEARGRRRPARLLEAHVAEVLQAREGRKVDVAADLARRSRDSGRR